MPPCHRTTSIRPEEGLVFVRFAATPRTQRTETTLSAFAAEAPVSGSGESLSQVAGAATAAANASLSTGTTNGAVTAGRATPLVTAASRCSRLDLHLHTHLPPLPDPAHP